MGLGSGTVGSIGAGGTVYVLTGGSASASAITYALGMIGGFFGGGMAAGLAAVIGGPAALGLGGYVIGKFLNHSGDFGWSRGSSNNIASLSKQKNLKKIRQPLAQTYSKVNMLNVVKDFASEYEGDKQKFDGVDVSRSNSIYKNFLTPSNLNNVLDLSYYSFPKGIGGLLRVAQDKTLSIRDRDRILLLIGWVSLMYYLVHFCDADFAGDEDEMYDILDLIDGYVGAISNRTPEALYLYYLANMFSADRFENSIPSAKLDELRQVLSQINLIEGETEFKVDGWKKIESIISKIMGRIIS